MSNPISSSHMSGKQPNGECIRRLEKENEELLKEKAVLERELFLARNEAQARQEQVEALRKILSQRRTDQPRNVHLLKRSVSPWAFFILLAFSLPLAIFSLITILKKDQNTENQNDSKVSPALPVTMERKQVSENKPAEQLPNQHTIDTNPGKPGPLMQQPGNIVARPAEIKDPGIRESNQLQRNMAVENAETYTSVYKVARKAFFHNQPDESTRRNAFIVHWNKAILKPLQERNGFIYIVFENHLGQVSKGWLNKKDLVALSQ